MRSVAAAYSLPRPILSADLALQLGFEHDGPVRNVVGITSSDGAAPGYLCFGIPASGRSGGAIWITELDAVLPSGSTALRTGRIRLGFIQALHFLRETGHWPVATPGQIAHSAVIDPSATVHPGATIGEACVIGPGSIIHASVELGAGVTIGAYCVLGHAGFGYERQEDGTPLHFPHLGRLVVEDDVVVGNFCSISRGTLEDTWIGRGTRIDDQSYIAHNVQIGQNALVMSGVRLNGRVRIGKNCWLGTNALVREGRSVADEAVIGMGSVVVESVAAGQVVAGNPARSLR